MSLPASENIAPLFNNVYNQTLAENERNLNFWDGYLRNLKELNFNIYTDKLKVPILAPIGSRIMFRGHLQHTNEVTVALGADYFVKCSVAQAEVLRQHRIKVAESKISQLLKERDFIQNHLQLSNQSIYQDRGVELHEPYNEDEDKKWREQHRDNIKREKQNKPATIIEEESEMTEEELWDRLDELELQEELDEMRHTELTKNRDVPKETVRKGIENQNEPVYNENIDSNKSTVISLHDQTDLQENNEILTENDDESNKISNDEKDNIKQNELQPESNKEILEKVLKKQSELEQKLSDLKNRDKVTTTTEDQLMSRLEELEHLEELEDEIDRLDDFIYTEETETEIKPKIKRSVLFADEEDTETLQLTFSHSDTNPDCTPFDINRGITKPSDIYEAFSHLFSKDIKPNSILKLSPKNDCYDSIENTANDMAASEEYAQERIVNTIDIKDVSERLNVSETVEDTVRPPSLFKFMRQQQKKLYRGVRAKQNKGFFN